MVLFCGCDPYGLRTVELELPGPNDGPNRIVVDSPYLQEALRILDVVATKHGFHLSDDEQGYIRVYSKTVNPDRRILKCRLHTRPQGLEITFGEYGFLEANPEAQALFLDARTTLIQRYGTKNVKSHWAHWAGSPR